MRYGLVIFDLDGTIVDSRHALIETCHDVRRAMGLPPLDDGILVRSIGRNIVESIRENYGADEEFATEFARRFFECYPRHSYDVGLFDGITDVIRTVGEDAVVAIATNNDLDGTMGLLRMLGIRDLFDHVRGIVDSDGPTKTHMIRDLMETTGMDPDGTVMIGDSVYDFRSASEAGVGFIGAAYGYTPEAIAQLPSIGDAYSPEDILRLLGIHD